MPALPGEHFRIGGATNYDDFVGIIDELAIYDHALTPARVAAHWEAATR
jgi:hypothetical protein